MTKEQAQKIIDTLDKFNWRIARRPRDKEDKIYLTYESIDYGFTFSDIQTLPQFIKQLPKGMVDEVFARLEQENILPMLNIADLVKKELENMGFFQVEKVCGELHAQYSHDIYDYEAIGENEYECVLNHEEIPCLKIYNLLLRAKKDNRARKES